jgi:uncharacterized Zn-finger protein
MNDFPTISKGYLLHNEGRRFECTHPSCSKTFVRKSDLSRHIRGHSGSNRCTCQRCGASYSRKDALLRHLRSCASHPRNSRRDKYQHTVSRGAKPTIVTIYHARTPDDKTHQCSLDSCNKFLLTPASHNLRISISVSSSLSLKSLRKDKVSLFDTSEVIRE